MKATLFIVGLFFLIPMAALPQMRIGNDTLSGIEWIQEGQTYFQIQVTEEGMYQISLDLLREVQIPVDLIADEHWQLWHNGQAVPLLPIIEENQLQALMFYAESPNGGLDQYLFDQGVADLLHPDYGLITDTMSFYLSWSAEGPQLFYERLDTVVTQPPTPQKYYWAEQETSYHEQWVKPYFKLSGANVYRSKFLRGEGFASPLMHSYTQEIIADQAFEGPDAQLSVRFLGDFEPHLFTLAVNGQERYRSNHPSFDLVQIELPIEAPTYTQPFEWSMQGNLDALDRFQLASVRLAYPRKPIVENAAYLEGIAAASAPFYQFEGAGENRHYLDLDGLKYYPSRFTGSAAEVWAFASAAQHRFVFFEEEVPEITSLKEVTLIDTRPLTTADFIILSSKRYEADGSIQAYASYRASEAGGSYQTAILYYEDLLHHWGYGVPMHPQGIKNFAYWLSRQNPNDPKIFLIGKGREYPVVRLPEQRSAPEHDDYVLPTYGYPSSDHLLFAAPGESAARFAMGRLSISQAADIRDYLAKVRAKEVPNPQPTYENAYWQKRIIHLEGGGSLSPLVSTYMADMRHTLEDTRWSPEIQTFNRLSSSGIEKPVTDQVFDEINRGVSLVSFIGHSATTNLDFDINNPEKYSNYGTFPLLVALGCYSGNINTAQQSIGELYTSYENGGFIASLATSGTGELTQLYLFARSLYRTLGAHAHEWTIGNLIREALQDRQASDPRHVAQLMLYGDPAIRLFHAQGPDYTFDVSSLQTEPERIDSNTDSVDVSIDIINLGLQSDEEIPIVLKHSFGANQEVLYHDTISAVDQRTRFHQKVSIRSRDGLNINELDWTIDPENSLTELPDPAARNNNNSSALLNQPLSFYVFSNGITLEQPYRYAIIDQPQTELGFSTNDPLQENARYFIEMAHSKTFSEDVLYRDTIVSAGAYIHLPLPLSLDSGQVYFWRVGFDRQDGVREWKSSSFLYLPGKSGWNQSVAEQFEENPICDYRWHEDRMFFKKELVFSEILNTYKGNGIGENGIIYGGVNFRSVRTAFQQIEEGIAITVFDTLRNFFQTNTEGLYGSVNNSGQVIHAYPFRTQTLEDRVKVIDFLQNHIPDHSYVFVYTIADNEIRGEQLNIRSWLSDSVALGSSIVHELEALIAQKIRQVATEGIDIYTYAFRKGQGALNEGFTSQEFEFLRVGMTLGRRLNSGRMSSPEIRMQEGEPFITEWSVRQEEDTDFNLLTVQDELGQNLNQSSAFIGSDSLNAPGNRVNFDYFSADSTLFRTAPQLDFIRFYYAAPHDWLWAPDLFYEVPDSIFAGDALRIRSAIRQIGLWDQQAFIPVRVQLIENGKVIQDSITTAVRQDSFYLLDYLAASDELQASFLDIRLQINPLGAFSERNPDNNLLNTRLTILKDEQAPFLEVRLEQQLMQDGQFVSYQPEFEFSVWDFESPLPLHRQHLQWNCIQPDGSAYPLVPDEEVFHIESGLQNQKLELFWHPKFTQEGTYELQVQAEDGSGNEAPLFQSHFTIRAIGALENIQVVPNPNQGSFQLHYDLLASRVPEKAEFSLINAQGQMVLQQPLEDFLRVGRAQISKTIECPECVPGTYLFRIHQGASILHEVKILVVE